MPVAHKTLLAMQRDDGSWTGDFTDEYATAMALIALHVPEERLSLAAPDGAGDDIPPQP